MFITKVHGKCRGAILMEELKIFRRWVDLEAEEPAEVGLAESNPITDIFDCPGEFIFALVFQDVKIATLVGVINTTLGS
jgi:hypothetical protein